MVRTRILIAGCLLAVLAGVSCEGTSASELHSRECFQATSATFDRRIRPLLESDQPKTCNQCHLSGVDLGLFVRDDPCETRACLLNEGLATPEDIDRSPILGWISRAKPDSALITAEVITEEYEGFRDYLRELFACDDTACAGVQCGGARGNAVCGRATTPDEPVLVPNDMPCDSLSIETMFRDSVYVWRGRCSPCHHSNQPSADPTAPRWIDVDGACDVATVATLRNVLESGYIDLQQPEKSLLLLKPLSLDAGGVQHGGGEKFHDTEDEAYRSMLSFFEFYAGCAAAGAPYP